MTIIAIISLVAVVSIVQFSIMWMLIYLMIPLLFIIIAAIFFGIAKSNIEKWKLTEPSTEVNNEHNFNDLKNSK